MCDPSGLISGMTGGAILPWKVQDALGSVGGIAKGAMGAYQSYSQGSEEAKAAGIRSAQSQFATNLEVGQTSQAQERRLGANRAAFAKSGVKVSGTAKRLIDEQARLDEIELLKIKHAGNINVQAEKRAAKRAGYKAAVGAAESLTSDSFLGSLTDLFGLSK